MAGVHATASREGGCGWSCYLFAYEMVTEGVFLQDEWKVRPNLMLTLGIRWDDFGNPNEKEGYNPYSNIHLGPGSTRDEYPFVNLG